MNWLVLDIQGFWVEKNKFYPKELAAYDGRKICHFIFKKPFALDQLPINEIKKAKWTMTYDHCIPWYEGYTPAFEISEIIKNLTEEKNIQMVYVEGKEMCQYVQKYSLKPVNELSVEQLKSDGELELAKTELECFYHSTSPASCSLAKVFYFYKTIINRKQYSEV